MSLYRTWLLCCEAHANVATAADDRERAHWRAIADETWATLLAAGGVS